MLIAIKLLDCALDKVAFRIELRKEGVVRWSEKAYLIMTYEGNLDILIVFRGYLMLHYFLTDCEDHRLVSVRLFYVVIDDFVQKACLADTWST